MNLSLLPLRWAALILASALAATPVLAKDDDGKHGDKGGKHAEKDQRRADKHADKHERKADKHADKHERKADKHRDDDDRGPKRGAYFDDKHRQSVHHYYTSYSGKSCPPGLAKKNNGCMPPGQAKKWHVGQPLPPSVTVYTVPQPILVTLPPPPPSHQYVRVSGDILLIAVGTKLVVDGIRGVLN